MKYVSTFSTLRAQTVKTRPNWQKSRRFRRHGHRMGNRSRWQSLSAAQ